jgi:hypothetical protein
MTSFTKFARCPRFGLKADQLNIELDGSVGIGLSADTVAPDSAIRRVYRHLDAAASAVVAIPSRPHQKCAIEFAMKTKGQATQASLKRRIRQFYKLLNERNYARCHEMIDPRVRHRPSSVTLLQYANSAAEFLDHCGPLTVVDLHVNLHSQEPNTLYEGRDFAIGKTICNDSRGAERAFSERWVREGRTWYTRCTGFVTPVADK